MLTEQEKQEKKERRIALCRKVAALTDEQRNQLSSRMILPRNPEGHQLSGINTIILAFQGLENPTIVAGYQQWKANGRQVRKGEHGFMIRFPAGIGKKEEQVSVEPEDIHFLWTTVFDISQTEEITQSN